MALVRNVVVSEVMERITGVETTSFPVTEQILDKVVSPNTDIAQVEPAEGQIDAQHGDKDVPDTGDPTDV